MNERIKELEKQCWDHQTNHLDAERFAALVAAHEREECAKICDGQRRFDTKWNMACLRLSRYIRARGEEPWVKTYAGGKPNYTVRETHTNIGQWVGLTDEDVAALQDFAYANDVEFIRHIEAKLREKNS
jgi:hypothetical protein